ARAVGKGMTRTSQNDPLRIGAIGWGTGGGEVGMTLCPGKKEPGRWERDLEADLRAIRRWGGTALVTLIEPHEFGFLAVEALPEKARALGLEWHHLPIPDGGAPQAGFERRWLHSGAMLRARLRRGERVLVHCRGGLGRTGTVAAKLLVEAGRTPRDAINRVRAARPGAIETVEQERYVLGLASRSPEDERYAGQVLGCLLGGAVGDALGYEVEFDSLGDIRRRFGPAGLTEPVPHEGRFVCSDDTQMTLFTLEGLLGARKDGCLQDPAAALAGIRASYLDWLHTQGESEVEATGSLARQPVLRHRRAPGVTCLQGLRAGGKGKIGAPINDSKGCGGVMRVAPIGLVRDYTPEQAFELAARAAALTHGHPGGYLPAGALAAMIRLLLEGASLGAAAERALALLRERPGQEDTSALLRAALSLAHKHGVAHDEAIRQLGEGWTGDEALAIALYAALASDSVEEAVIIGANHDGDSDSTASIAGQLRALSEDCPLPRYDWARALDLYELLIDLAFDWIGSEPSC
ncbi:MAG TPA: ADP-ribosylglycohydrolase family protein, partial [Burkholderiales bacterium]|nr:ADP-ribosylglycohydrolase family protein [Burkholderiales bacterium]